MSFLLRLAARSAWNRRYTLGLMLLAIALSSAMLLGIERVRHEVRDSFSQSEDHLAFASGGPTFAVESAPLARNTALIGVQAGLAIV